ncbi:unnamed protein product [Schistosoma mattheei]|uniref:Abasic site processing protein HMCES n=1 Tax=Schistosoma mattheei TaxID=31246 RepID=A0AA85AX98_9TREM|nr:unnamed protein product [Schistosoma mattheei]
MCGRTACALEPSTICAKCQLNLRNNKEIGQPSWHNAPGGQKYYPSYNISPGSFTPVLVSNQFTDTKDKGHSLQCSFQEGKRCVVVVQGFYEWKVGIKKKQPFYFCPSNPDKLLMMAGLFAHNYEKQMYSYTIITTSSKGIMADVHSRMPIILDNDDDIYEWLDPAESNYKQAYQFLTDLADNLDNVSVIKYPVTSQVNNSTYNEPNCIKPITEEEEHKKMTKSYGSSNIMMQFLKRSNKDSTCDQTNPGNNSSYDVSHKNIDAIKKRKQINRIYIYIYISFIFNQKKIFITKHLLNLRLKFWHII